MSDKKNMLQQLPYNPNALSLVLWRNATGRKLYRFNRSRLREYDRRNYYLKQIVHARGLFQIKLPFACDYGDHIYIGWDFTCGHHAVFNDAATITIGDHVQMGNGVKLITSQPVKDALLRQKHYACAKPIVIEDHVYIGHNVVIAPGVTIGANSIIEDGSVVTQDIPPCVIAGGNPCEVQEDASEICVPFQTDGEEEVDKVTWKERLLDYVDLEKVDKTVKVTTFAIGTILGYQCVKSAWKHKVEWDKKKKQVNAISAPVRKAIANKDKACNCSCRLKNKK